MRWLIDGYNVIRRSPELSSREMVSLEGGRRALCDLLSATARASGDAFTVVFDGAGAGGTGSGGAGVNVVFSSARENADRVLIRLARAGGAVVSNDREVRQSVARAGAVVVTTDEFLAASARRGARPTRTCLTRTCLTRTCPTRTSKMKKKRHAGRARVIPGGSERRRGPPGAPWDVWAGGAYLKGV